jgi:UDP-N-acetylglucosamine 2-epimerase
VTLRDETEWVETVERGWNVLASADTARILQYVREFARPATHEPLYGAGQAAQHCVEILVST